MSTNYLRARRSGPDMFRGFKMFRVYRDCGGKLHKDGAVYAVFDNGRLIGEYCSETRAVAAFLNEEPVTSIRLSEYEGIQEGLR